MKPKPHATRGENHCDARRREHQNYPDRRHPQIDTPYLDEQSNGLTYLIDRLRGKDLYCHITLEKGERSALANLANDHL